MGCFPHLYLKRLVGINFFLFCLVQSLFAEASSMTNSVDTSLSPTESGCICAKAKEGIFYVLKLDVVRNNETINSKLIWVGQKKCSLINRGDQVQFSDSFREILIGVAGKEKGAKYSIPMQGTFEFTGLPLKMKFSYIPESNEALCREESSQATAESTDAEFS